MEELKIEVPQGYEIDKEKSTFEKIIFKKIETELPKTWKEYCENNPVGREYFITGSSGIVDTRPSRNRECIADENLLSTFKDAEAHLALIKLHRLRDVYRQGWVPNCNNGTIPKYCIVFKAGSLEICDYFTIVQFFLSFQSQEIAEKFLKNFRDLIEKAKELI